MRRSFLLGLLIFAFAIDIMAISYPSWFLYPRLYTKFITGFSYKGNPPVMDAEVMYCIFKKCEVSGYLETYTDKNLYFLNNFQYYYVYPIEEIDRINGKLVYYDRFVLSVLTGDYVEAFSLDKDVLFVKKIIDQDSVPAPSWIKKNTWADDNYYYAVGMFTSSGNSSECWKTSEEQAVFSILTSISMKFYSLNLTVDNTNLNSNEFKEFTRTEIKFKLSSIQVLERYPDLKDNLYYTYVKIPKKNVIPLSFDNQLK